MILSVNDLVNKYNYSVNSVHKISIDKQNMPSELWHLIPYLEYFVLDDQGERESLMESLPIKSLIDLASIIKQHNVEIDNWLGGIEATSYPYSHEYIYMTILRNMSEEYEGFC
jgi:hypothetical protein